jgi:hypothetical protein
VSHVDDGQKVRDASLDDWTAHGWCGVGGVIDASVENPLHQASDSAGDGARQILRGLVRRLAWIDWASSSACAPTLQLALLLQHFDVGPATATLFRALDWISKDVFNLVLVPVQFITC